MLASLIQGATFSFMGFVFLVVALGFYIRGRLRARGGIDVEGEVYDHGSYRGRHGRLMFSPRYRAVVNGQELTCGSGTATSWKRPPVGTRAKLSYFPNDAESPLRERGLGTAVLITVLVLVAVGAPLFATGATLLVTSLTSDEPLIPLPGINTPKPKHHRP